MILKMKKRNLLICILSASVGFASLGCASAPAPSPKATSSNSQALAKNSTKNTDYFDDWKYKGFGMALPQWVQPAIEGKTDKVVKFFPAEPAGGVAMIKAMAAPYMGIKFMPTGGINAKNLEDYLSFDKIICCGGSWMVKGELVKNGEFDKIRDLTAEARKLVDSIRK